MRLYLIDFYLRVSPCQFAAAQAESCSKHRNIQTKSQQNVISDLTGHTVLLLVVTRAQVGYQAAVERRRVHVSHVGGQHQARLGLLPEEVRRGLHEGALDVLVVVGGFQGDVGERCDGGEAARINALQGNEICEEFDLIER